MVDMLAIGYDGCLLNRFVVELESGRWLQQLLAWTVLFVAVVVEETECDGGCEVEMGEFCRSAGLKRRPDATALLGACRCFEKVMMSHLASCLSDLQNGAALPKTTNGTRFGRELN